MELPEDYLRANSLQQHDTDDVISEFREELSQMQGKCLDIGCGPGQVTKKMLLTLPDATEIVGADISQEMVLYARKNYADKRLSYIVLDIESEELPSDQIKQYDNAISFYCLHWCKNLRLAFQNIHKLLQPEGKALVMFLGFNIGLEAYIRLQPRFHPYLQDAHRYIPYFQRIQCKNMRASLEKMLKNTGFKILHVSDRKKSFECTKEILKKHAYAVNPFVKRFPDENMKEEFLEQLIKEVINAKTDVTIFNKNNEEKIKLKYNLLIAYVQKPSSN